MCCIESRCWGQKFLVFGTFFGHLFQGGGVDKMSLPPFASPKLVIPLQLLGDLLPAFFTIILLSQGRNSVGMNPQQILVSCTFWGGLLKRNEASGGLFDPTALEYVNPLNPALNPICHLLALLGVHHFLHVSRIRVKSLTIRLLMTYIYIYIYIYIYMEHLFLMFLDHTQRRSTVGRTPLDE